MTEPRHYVYSPDDPMFAPSGTAESYEKKLRAIWDEFPKAYQCSCLSTETQRTKLYFPHWLSNVCPNCAKVWQEPLTVWASFSSSAIPQNAKFYAESVGNLGKEGATRAFFCRVENARIARNAAGYPLGMGEADVIDNLEEWFTQGDDVDATNLALRYLFAREKKTQVPRVAEIVRAALTDRCGLDRDITPYLVYRQEHLPANHHGHPEYDVLTQLVIDCFVLGATWKALVPGQRELVPFYELMARKQLDALRLAARDDRKLPKKKSPQQDSASDLRDVLLRRVLPVLRMGIAPEAIADALEKEFFSQSEAPTVGASITAEDEDLP